MQPCLHSRLVVVATLQQHLLKGFIHTARVPACGTHAHIHCMYLSRTRVLLVADTLLLPSCLCLLQIDVQGQNQEVHRAFLAGNTAFIFTNSSE